ncbi:MAG: hypothetical protein HYS13_04895 [Planctomycetia bacterium]|nr:hypothetical protein [Planctomycetia bacterium]
MKLHAWLAVDVAASPLGDSLWQLALIVGEFALAAWLLSGRAELGSWVAAVLCFSAFAGVSIAKALAREASCGCFGSLEISPWLAGLIDVAVVTGLCIWRPTVALSGTRLSRHRVGACLLVAAPVVLACAAALGMFVDAPAVLTDDGTIAGNGHTVLVEPDNWVGKRLPLLAYLDIAQQVESGQWRVVFFREGCASCSAAISATFSDGGTEEGQSVAVVRTGGSPAQHRTQWRCLSGQTDTSIEWLMETPLIVDLMDGVVTRITTSRKSPQRGWTSARSPTQSLEGRPGV